MSAAAKDVLESVPSWENWNVVEDWVAAARVAAAAPLRLDGGELCSLSGSEIAGASASVLGRYADISWRRFALATFAADLCCYFSKEDQVNFDRLLYVMHAFPEGFRVWWSRISDGAWWPVGYSGWYPVSDAVFSRIEAGDPSLSDRLIPPVRENRRPGCLLYVFNYSVTPSLRASPTSRALIKGLAADIDMEQPAALAAITVSADGVRVAERFGMRAQALLRIGDLTERIYIARRPS